MYTDCIFDLYGTLVDIHTEEEKKELWEKLAMFYGYYGALYTPDELHRRFEKIRKELEKGKSIFRTDAHEASPEIRMEDVFRRLFEEKNVEAQWETILHAGQFFRILSTEYIRLYDGTTEMLEALKAVGKRIYLLSNAQRIFTEYELKALGIYTYFDDIFISSDYGVKKPDLSFFEKLTLKYQLTSQTAIMVGNDGICDIAGAKAAGLSTLYIHSNLSPEGETPEADYRLEKMDMNKVKEILLAETMI